MKLLAFLLLLLIALTSSGQTENYDLAIKNATVFDSKKRTLSKNQTILINAGIIVNVADSKKDLPAKKQLTQKGNW
jgi:N-acyl-D-aspartate/D-glutamate deacylase